MQIRKRVRIGRIGDAILICLAAFASVGLSQTPVRKLRLLGEARRKLGKLRERDYERTVAQLKRVGVLSDSRSEIRLTERGKRILGIKGFFSSSPVVPKRRDWDGKWRIVMFDVRERRKRDLLRAGLKSMNFLKLQQSVWVHPGECASAVGELAARLGAERDVRIAVACRLDGDGGARLAFFPDH